MNDVMPRGVTFAGKVALVNSVGKSSTNSGVVSGLLAGGCKVMLLAQMKDGADEAAWYRSQYEEWGAKGSKLLVLTFNGGSAQDCTTCVDYVYDALKPATCIDTTEKIICPAFVRHLSGAALPGFATYGSVFFQDPLAGEP